MHGGSCRRLMPVVITSSYAARMPSLRVVISSEHRGAFQVAVDFGRRLINTTIRHRLPDLADSELIGNAIGLRSSRPALADSNCIWAAKKLNRTVILLTLGVHDCGYHRRSERDT